MKVKTQTLQGAALDWAVAKSLGGVQPIPETTWEDVKDIEVPFQMWEVVTNSNGDAWIKPISVVRCGVDHTVGATAPSISAIDSKGETFRGSIRDYYLTALQAENEVRRITKGDLSNPLKYSTKWKYGGPLVEESKINLVSVEGEYNPQLAGTTEAFSTYWVAEVGRLRPTETYGPQGDDWGSVFQVDGYQPITGPTPLIAAMRAFCCSKLGDEVEVPDALTGGCHGPVRPSF